MRPTICNRAQAMWRAATPLQRAFFAALSASILYITVLFRKVALDDGAETGIRIAACLFLLFTLRLLLHAVGMLYDRFLVTAFHKFLKQAESVQAEDAFIQALAPREFELLYQQTLPRCGFIGVLNAHQVAKNAAPIDV